MKKNKQWLIGCGVVLLLIAGGFYLNRGESVNYIEVKSGEVVKTVALEAVIESSSVNTVFSKTDGMILAVYQKTNDAVEAKAPVVEVEVSKRHELNQLTKTQQEMVLKILEKPEYSDLMKSLSPYMSLYSKAEEQYNEAIANYDNLMLLLNAGAVDSNDVREAALTLGEAGDKLNTAEDKWWTASILVYEVMTKAEKKQWDRVEESYLTNKLEQSRIVIEAPMTGMLSSVFVEPGHLVRKNGVLFTLVDPAKLKIKMEVNPEKAELLKKGQLVQVKYQSSDTETTGTITNVATHIVEKVNSDGTVSKTVLVEAKFNEPQFEAKLGDVLTLEIQVKKLESVLYLPLTAIIQKDGQFWIWYNHEGVLTEKKVTPILVGDDKVALPGTLENYSRVVVPAKELKLGDRIQ